MAAGKKNLWKELNSECSAKSNDVNSLDFDLLEELFLKTSPVIIENQRAFRPQSAYFRQSAVDLDGFGGTGGVDEIGMSLPNFSLNDHHHHHFSIMNQRDDQQQQQQQQQPPLIQILDSKQNMNVIVYLKQIKVPLNEFIKLIVNGQSKEIGIDNLNCLKKILPEKSDVDAIRSHYELTGDLNQFGKAERFIKMLTDIKCYELRINVMNFIEEFAELEVKLREPLEAYCHCSDRILNSSSLKAFIKIVLASGNYINMVR